MAHVSARKGDPASMRDPTKKSGCKASCAHRLTGALHLIDEQECHVASPAIEPHSAGPILNSQIPMRVPKRRTNSLKILANISTGL
jgi:hypothetical protein